MTEPLAAPFDHLDWCRVHAAQLGTVLELLEQRERWMAARGITQWPEGSHRREQEQLRGYLEDECWFLAFDKDKAVAGLLLKSVDPRWRAHDPEARALYLHKLTVAPNQAGKGLGAALLDWAEQHSLALGYQRLRLDCWTESGKLKAFYENRGFEPVAVVEDGLTLQLYEKTLSSIAKRSTKK